MFKNLLKLVLRPLLRPLLDHLNKEARAYSAQIIGQHMELLRSEVAYTLESTRKEILSLSEGAIHQRLEQLRLEVLHMIEPLPEELRKETLSASEESIRVRLEQLRGEALQLIQPLRKEMLDTSEEAIQQRLSQLRFDALQQQAPFQQRLTRLEAIITEHPSVAARGFDATAFPSPVFSVIMPVWNRATLVSDAIRSVQAQSFTDWELLVIDDGSTDATAAAVAPFLADTRIRYLRQEHAGQCRARNTALKEAKGALIAYLDSDNLWYPEFLGAAGAAFAADENRLCLYGAMITESHRPGERILFEPFDRDRLLENNFIGMSTFVHRRALYEKFGGFDEKLSCVEDWDLILRYTQHAPAYALPVRAVRYRAVDTQRITNHAPFAKDMARIYAKWAKDKVDSAE